MVTPNRTSKIIELSEFVAERGALYTIASTRIAARNINQINFDIHDHYRLDEILIRERIDAIIKKFRKCQMTFFLYFDELDHDLLVGRSTNLPLSRERLYQSSGGVIKQYFEVNEKSLYQELIDYHFQEFILFTSSVLENMVYLSETLIRKVSIHPKKNAPSSIPMKNYMEMLEYLYRLNYRNPEEPIATCLKAHKFFLDKYLPTIATFRNRYIHAFPRLLVSTGHEYSLTGVQLPLTSSSAGLAVDEFAKAVIDNLILFIPQFFEAIAATINSTAEIPA